LDAVARILPRPAIYQQSLLAMKRKWNGRDDIDARNSPTVERFVQPCCLLPPAEFTSYFKLSSFSFFQSRFIAGKQNPLCK
jgi:hypothetical protein